MNHSPTNDIMRIRLIREGIAKAGDTYQDFCHCPGCHQILDAELVQYGAYPLPWAWCAECCIGVRLHVVWDMCWAFPRYEIVDMNKIED